MGKAANECYVIAKYDYVAQGPQELNLQRDERLLLLDGSKHWWRVVNTQNQVGYIPMNYVRKEKTSLLDNIKKSFGKGSSFSHKTLPHNVITSPMSQPNSPLMTRHHAPLTHQHSYHGSVGNSPQHFPETNETSWAYVKYNYTAQQPDELSLTKGTRVLVLEKSGDGWWRGKFENKIGWFPSNYTSIEPLPQPATSMGSSVYGSSNGEHMYSAAENIVEVVVALHSFAAKNGEELSFVKGERLEVLDRPPADPEWARARNARGLIGLIPKNYVQEINSLLQSKQGLNGQSAAKSVSDISRSLDALSLATVQAPLNLNGSSTLMQDKEWFFGSITRAEADVLLVQYGQEGDFLVRVSESNAGGYSVSLKAFGRNKHFRVHLEGALFVIGQRKFTSMDQLVEHYKRYPIFTSEKGERLFLIQPLKKPSDAAAVLTANAAFDPQTSQ